MWFLGSTSRVTMMMDERLSASARCLQSAGNAPSTVHSIEAILGFKVDTVFHGSAPYSGVGEELLLKDAEQNQSVTPAKKSQFAESLDSECS